MNFKKVIRLLLVAMATFPSVFLSAQAAGQSATQTSVPRRVVSAIDPADRVPLASGPRPWLRKAADAGAVPGQTVSSHMLLLLQRSVQQQQALDEYMGDIQNPSSPSYHHWLTPAQFANAYGVNAEDVASITSWLQSEGFTVDKVSPARNIIEFSGTVNQLQQAFQTQIHRMVVGSDSEATAISSVQVPRALAPVIRGLVNLDGAHPHKLYQPGPTGKYDPATHSIKPDFTVFDNGTPLLFVDPSDAATIYDTPNANLNPNYKGATLDGAGVTVGVVGDSNVNLDLVANYRQSFLGETAANQNLPTVIVDGNDPGQNGDEVESWLDLEVLGGIAPNAKIYYYASQNDDLTYGLQNAIIRAVDDNLVSILSISYGSCEAAQGTAGNAFFSEVYEQAAAQGITITVSSGDSGSANCDSDANTTAVNGLTVNAIASTPYNIAVGGTDFDVLGKNFSTYVEDTTSGAAPYYLTVHQYIPEEPWNDSTQVNTTAADNTPLLLQGQTNIIGAGGGASSVYTKPAFQTALTPQDGARDLPDVSFLAANGLYGASWVLCERTIGGDDCQNNNGQFTANSTFHGIGGTSAAAPAFAGMLTLLEQSLGSRLGQANNVLYQLAASKYSTVIHDITTGNNSVVCSPGSPNCSSNDFLTSWNAATGYDEASGLGSVDVAQMVSNWNSVALTPTTTALTIDSSTSPVTVPHGTTLNFQIAVNPAAVTGDASLVANTQSLGGLLTVPLTKGAGSAGYNGLPGGQYTVYARYGGDTGDAASSSAPISVNISREASTTALSVNVYDATTGSTIPSTGPIPYGAYLFLDATVFGTAEGQSASQGVATGVVTFDDGSSAIGTANIGAIGYASLNNASAGKYLLNAGTHKLAASFPGDASYNASNSAPVTVAITRASPQMQIQPAASSTSTAVYDLIQVAIAEAGIGLTATGTVTLQSNGVTLGTAPLVALDSSAGLPEGVATLNVSGSQLQVGVDTLTAIYSGDINYNGASVTAPLTVSQSTFALSTSPINVTAGATSGNTATVHVTPLGYFTGIVNLTCAITSAPASATNPLTCSIPASANVTGLNAVNSTLTANSEPSTTSGTYIITVTGVDAATGKLTSAATSTVTVTGTVPLAPAIAVGNGGPVTVAAGATTNNTSTLTVTPSNGFTGAVNLACAVTSSPAAANDPVTCSLSSPSVAVSGTGAVTATLTVNSTATTTAALERGFGTGGAMLALVLVFIPARRRRRLASLAGAVALVATLGIVVGCGSNGSAPGNNGGGSGGGTPPPTTTPGTTAGAYVITVTATAANVTAATTTINITVN
jgi:trimeric autotransporter adhesin